jgi:hypothetical protein
LIIGATLFMASAHKYIRHPTEIPVEICSLSPTLNNIQTQPHDGVGISFICTYPWQQGTFIKIRLPMVKPAFEAIVEIVWVRKRHSYYEVGVKFLNEEEAFQGRMCEQMCRIEIYRQKQAGEGRKLSVDDAAMEWISRYAEQFFYREQVMYQA